MEQKVSPESVLRKCMEQKLLLLTKIANLTKQMEVQSRQKEIEIGDLPEQRQIYIGRLKKCEAIIQNACCMLPVENQERSKAILSGKATQEGCTAEETEFLQCSIKCRGLLQNILSMDSICRKRLQKECDRLQKLMQSGHRATPQGAYQKHS
jgi:hypothetical protein